MPQEIPDWVGIVPRSYASGKIVGPHDAVLKQERFRWRNHFTYFVVLQEDYPFPIGNVKKARQEYYERVRDFIKNDWIRTPGIRSTYF